MSCTMCNAMSYAYMYVHVENKAGTMYKINIVFYNNVFSCYDHTFILSKSNLNCSIFRRINNVMLLNVPLDN